ncbi:MAG: NADH:flavin oxidoreductase/NADH oxidase [Chthonomonadales bacterium]
MADHLFSPLTIRDVTLKNRIAVSPMCMYSSEDGFANDWHLVHLGSRAVGGAGLVVFEASGVEARGRITAGDLGIYKDEHIEDLSHINSFIHKHGSATAMQIAHAGRKASCDLPINGGGPLFPDQGGWQTISASPIPFDEGYTLPHELTIEEIGEVVKAFGQAARRSLEAGFDIVEIHGAHGYLLHEFYSPLSNKRTDTYGGSFENRTRIVRKVAVEVRKHWPERLPLFIRISATDWTEGGWDIAQSIELAKSLKPLGVDLVDASSGANVPVADIPYGPGYQTAFAEAIRKESQILSGAVGAITSPAQADHIIRTGQADIVLLARELLRDPYWPRRAAKELNQTITPPIQYNRSW